MPRIERRRVNQPVPDAGVICDQIAAILRDHGPMRAGEIGTFMEIPLTWHHGADGCRATENWFRGRIIHIGGEWDMCLPATSLANTFSPYLKRMHGAGIVNREKAGHAVIWSLR